VFEVVHEGVVGGVDLVGVVALDGVEVEVESVVEGFVGDGTFWGVGGFSPAT